MVFNGKRLPAAGIRDSNAGAARGVASGAAKQAGVRQGARWRHRAENSGFRECFES
jgi:hypothetical protein